MSGLALSVKKNEPIYIGDDITITIFEFRESCVRIKIEAPKSVRILRDKVYQRLFEKHEITIDMKPVQEPEAIQEPATTQQPVAATTE